MGLSLPTSPDVSPQSVTGYGDIPLSARPAKWAHGDRHPDPSLPQPGANLAMPALWLVHNGPVRHPQAQLVPALPGLRSPTGRSSHGNTERGCTTRLDDRPGGRPKHTGPRTCHLTPP